MKLINLVFLLPVMALALMGQSCPAQDVQVRNALAEWCPAVDVAYAYYTPLKRFVPVSYQRPAETAFAELQLLCDGRETATALVVITKGTFAAEKIYDAIQAARRNGASVAYQGNIKALEGMMDKIRQAQ